MLFLYEQVLKVDLPWLDNITPAQVSRRLPTVLTAREARTLLDRMSGTKWLVASLLYGSGLRLLGGTFEFTLDHLVDHERDLSALDVGFDNDETGAPAYDPRVMLKIVLLGCNRGLVSSRAIEQACRRNVMLIALSGDSAPSCTHIARFVRELGEEVGKLFTQVLMNLRPAQPQRAA